MIDEDDQLQLISVDTNLVRIKEENKTVNKMVTLPNYLVVIGKTRN